MSDSWQRVTRCQGIESDKAMEIQALGFEPSTLDSVYLVISGTGNSFIAINFLFQGIMSHSSELFV